MKRFLLTLSIMFSSVLAYADQIQCRGEQVTVSFNDVEDSEGRNAVLIRVWDADFGTRGIPQIFMEYARNTSVSKIRWRGVEEKSSRGSLSFNFKTEDLFLRTYTGRKIEEKLQCGPTSNTHRLPLSEYPRR